MGRLSARLAKSSADAIVRSRVSSARSQIQAALRDVHRMRGRREIDTGKAIRVERDLRRVLVSLGDVSRVAPLVDMDDPDLTPEKDREERWREEMFRRRQEEESNVADRESEEAEASEPVAEVTDV